MRKKSDLAGRKPISENPFLNVRLSKVKVNIMSTESELNTLKRILRQFASFAVCIAICSTATAGGKGKGGGGSGGGDPPASSVKYVIELVALNNATRQSIIELNDNGEFLAQIPVGGTVHQGHRAVRIATAGAIV